MEVLLDGKANLEERFSENGTTAVAPGQGVQQAGNRVSNFVNVQSLFSGQHEDKRNSQKTEHTTHEVGGSQSHHIAAKAYQNHNG